ncbi:type VI secretion system tip protein VgrG, partial [Halarcobacter ebronensis]
IIDNDKEETVEANSTLTVNKDYTQNIKENQINTVEKEKITTVKEDYEIFANKDLNTIVKRDKKTYIEENLSLSIRNILLKYIEKDVSDKYLENLFIQVANEMGVDISNSFHLDTTNALFEGINEITLEASSGISLRCGGNVATVDSSGIFFHTSNYVKNSPNNGVEGAEVVVEGDIINPRITNHYSTAISKQLEQILYMQADTTLKNGRSVKVTIQGLDKNDEVIAQETKTTTVNKNKIIQEFDTKQLKKAHNLEEDDIVKYTGEFSV